MQDQAIVELTPYLKERGLRITPQRISILKVIIALKTHVTVDEIHKKLPNMSLATIYSNVKLFVNLRILSELPYGNGLSKYELFQTTHYHVICSKCGKIKDFNYPILKEVEYLGSNLTQYKIHSHQLEFYGLCKICQ
ncbi:Fur family transcriptional regulator [Halalkalibacter alkalisediminis]|uniref:Fur family transcriptional regulator n=1 Tax=Halalkalibacter alkalisediminis TaxID=935616 RepID=A0ABV6NNU7_9BACI|nr:Fur family transcriptional regulator [Halalkalibacter alkalisediminis]